MLPIVLLGIRSTIKEDLNATAAEMIYGTGIRLPGEFFLPSQREANSHFANQLRKHFSEISPRPVSRHGKQKVFVFKDHRTSSHVFLRHDAVKNLLQPPYDGPYKVLKRDEKNFVISKDNKNVTVSIDRLKPAFLLSDECELSEGSNETERVNEQLDTDRNNTTEIDRKIVSRSGRCDVCVSLKDFRLVSINVTNVLHYNRIL